MLGANSDQPLTVGDEVLKRVAERMGAAHTFTKVPVGILNTPTPGQPLPDPCFGGAGPNRQGCIYCGACMTGCRHNAKNTLLKNYLHLAEAAGATIAPMTTVKAVRPRASGGYAVDCGALRLGKSAPAHAHHRAGRVRRRGAGDPAPPPPDEARGASHQPVRPIGQAHPHERRVARRGYGEGLQRRLLVRRLPRHVLPPGRAHARRDRAQREGLQHHEPAHDSDDTGQLGGRLPGAQVAPVPLGGSQAPGYARSPGRCGCAACPSAGSSRSPCRATTAHSR